MALIVLVTVRKATETVRMLVPYLSKSDMLNIFLAVSFLCILSVLELQYLFKKGKIGFVPTVLNSSIMVAVVMINDIRFMFFYLRLYNLSFRGILPHFMI